MTIVTASCPKPTCAAHTLTAQQRLDLALDSLHEHGCVSHLALQHDVSRKFVYQQQHKAQKALRDASCPAAPPVHDVLFHLPVTRNWLRQFVPVAVLVGHSSLRGCCEMLDCLLGLRVSFGWVQSVVKDAITRAKPINQSADLSRVLFAALDEIFQNGWPVLAVVDVESTYCCLLDQEEHRDGDTWGVHLLDLQRQGFAPLWTIADGGKGLRSGLRQALPGVPCDADNWHALRDVGEVARFLENRAYDAMAAHDKLRRKPGGASAEQIQAAHSEQDRAIALADDVALLLSWLRHDVPGVAGPSLSRRQEAFDFVLIELMKRRALCEHRLGPVCSLLAGQGEDLMGFCARLDREIADLALYAKVSEQVVREVIAIQEMPRTDGRRWRREGALRKYLGERYEALSEQVEGLRGGVVRASSVVENVNSRVRNYLFLRKEVGGGYLELLRFFLNHRRFLRSEHAERVGKSPAELLNGSGHGHWLELLGFRRFSQDQTTAAAAAA